MLATTEHDQHRAPLACSDEVAVATTSAPSSSRLHTQSLPVAAAATRVAVTGSHSELELRLATLAPDAKPNLNPARRVRDRQAAEVRARRALLVGRRGRDQ
ncbi:hypothetical protein Ade02nite_23630 [Paractinoplanes deccanensis]|uniref:Uncharacterized protein n=1 Tax=Paractinoplanes deccanensis TaxID=113561 RepID=A0ABQ3Y159_9ACTN|nr:hypothetical protein Ade02nite_23630 [Actinoplanes deccanensis]